MRFRDREFRDMRFRDVRRKAVKIAAGVLLAAACTLAPAAAAFADGPSGPASDTETVSREAGPSGPGADREQTQNPAQGGGQGQADPGQSAQPQAGQAQAGQADPGQSAQPQAGQADPGQAGQAQAGQADPRQAGQVQAGQADPGQAAQGQPAPEQSAQANPQQPIPGQAGAAAPIPEGMVLSGGRLLDPNMPMIALTFDDGPYAPVGNRIMDCLEKYNGRATFFVVGNRVPSYKTEILRMQVNGHEVANHTYEHKYLTKLGAAEIRSQIDRCNQTVASVTGTWPSLVRLPGGLQNSTVTANVNYPMIMWDIDTEDWKTRNAQKTVAAVVGKVRDGDIVLMHELYTQTGDAAEVIIPTLAQQGYQLVTVSELAQFRGGVQAGKSYSRFRP